MGLIPLFDFSWAGIQAPVDLFYDFITFLRLLLDGRCLLFDTRQKLRGVYCTSAVSSLLDRTARKLIGLTL